MDTKFIYFQQLGLKNIYTPLCIRSRRQIRNKNQYTAAILYRDIRRFPLVFLHFTIDFYIVSKKSSANKNIL